MCVETFGAWSERGRSFIKDGGKRIKAQTGKRRSTSFLFQSIGMAIQRGNALSILGTIDDEIGSLDEVHLL